MIRRTIVSCAAAAAVMFLGAVGAQAVGLGIGVPVSTTPVTGVVSSPQPLGDAQAAVAGAVESGSRVVRSSNDPSHSDELFAGAPDAPHDGVSAKNYGAFESLVSGAPAEARLRDSVVTSDACSGDGVDGGVTGLPRVALRLVTF